MLDLLLAVFWVGVGWLFWSTWKKYGRGPLLWAAGVLALTLALGAWSIFQSRSSTAVIGFIYLPGYGLITSLAALLLAFGRRTSSWLRMGVGAVVILAVWTLFIVGGVELRTQNAARDTEYLAQLERQKRIAEELKIVLAENPGREELAIEEYYRNSTYDRARALEVLQTKFVSPKLLLELSRSQDPGILLSVIRNENVTPDLIEAIYSRALYKDYFHADLARHPKTPRSVLLQVADGKTTNVTEALLKHTNSNCEIVQRLQNSVRSGYLSEKDKAEQLELIKAKSAELCR